MTDRNPFAAFDGLAAILAPFGAIKAALADGRISVNEISGLMRAGATLINMGADTIDKIVTPKPAD